MTRTERAWQVLDGVPEPDSGVIELSLKKVSSAAKGWRMIAAKDGKSAVTEWRKLAVKDGRAMVIFTPRTGRTHQIRSHALHGLGFGIAGDPVYGRGEGPMLLHSRFLSIPRGNKAPAEATAPLPSTFAAAGFGPEYLDDAGL